MEQTEAGIRDLLAQLSRQKQKALEENFYLLSQNFDDIFKRIVPGGKTELKLVKTSPEDS